MMNKTVLNLMNEQIKHELYSAYLYLSMSAYFEANNLAGFAHWMRVQAQEELVHAMKFYDFILERGERIALLAIEQPPTEFQSPLAIFEQALEHEKSVTAKINNIYAAAVKEADYPGQTFLQWFVDEQVEEEKNATSIVETLKLVGSQGNALYMLDRELGRREAEED